TRGTSPRISEGNRPRQPQSFFPEIQQPPYRKPPQGILKPFSDNQFGKQLKLAARDTGPAASPMSKHIVKSCRKKIQEKFSINSSSLIRSPDGRGQTRFIFRPPAGTSGHNHDQEAEN
ncbi:MAG: hypothetical protein JW718_01690, partial [Desulfovibrionaceae bacterium]|nr:hypothetical protein [Desulfovibrionaceae bacterium]